MFGKILSGSLLAAVVLMVWGFFAWAITSDALGIVEGVSDEDALRSALQVQDLEDGAYFVPVEGFQGTEQQQAQWRERHGAGPLALLFLRREGVEPSPVVMLNGFAHFWAAALLAAWLLWMARESVPSYWGRVKLVTLAGVFAGFALHLSPSIWWYAPWSFSLYSLWATATAWLLAGMVLARFVRQ
jgi:hypothetical protein